MKIRWRQQEIIAVTFICCVLFINFFQDNIAIPGAEMEMRGHAFREHGVAFNYFYNYILPRLAPGLALYVFYLFLNLYVIPVLILRRKIFTLAIITGIGIWLLLLGIFAVSYYQSVFYSMLRNAALSSKILSIQYGISVTAMVFIGYCIYAYIREMTIKTLNREEGNRSFRIMLANNITGVALTYIAVFFLLAAFGRLRHDGMAIFYVFFLLPVIITCFINIYWLFPWQRRNAYPFRKIAGKLLIAPAILSLVCWIIFGMASGKDAPAFPLAVFAVLLLIATPVSWLLYISQRDRLDEMLNLQKSLGKTAADLQFLRSQINPHFLFNALNTIYGTALQENAERTAEGVQKLGDMMRFMLHENQEDRISLQKEINYLTNYIELQKLRTQVSKDIDISFTVKQESCEHTIAPMLLIPFVENAFKHGISLRERSWIKINISCDTEHVYFDVYNSVHPRREDDPERDRPGIGLDNVKQRLSLLYPQQHELQIRSTATEYFIHLTIKP